MRESDGRRSNISDKCSGMLPQSGKRKEERGYWKRRVLEALHIHQQPRISNLDCGLTINPSWLPLLEKPPSP